MLPVLTVGEPLVAAVPVVPEPLEVAPCCRLFPGGAEVNLAVGLGRLGVPCAFLGRIGADPLGRLVLTRLEEAGVGVAHLRADPRPTGLYLREWLPDGVRRPYYYRQGSAGAQLDVTDVAVPLERHSLVHLTGITPALGPGPRAAVRAIVSAAASARVPVSFDANFRPALWRAADFAEFVRPLLPYFTVLLVGEEESELLFGSADPDAAFSCAREVGVPLCVLRLGERGALAEDARGHRVARRMPARAVDPVGAGDAFDAGFLAARLSGATVADSLALGVYCGARAVEVLGEHEGAPTLASLPPAFARCLGSTNGPQLDPPA